MSENQDRVEEDNFLTRDRAYFLTNVLYCFLMKNKLHRLNGEPEETIEEFLQNWNSEREE
jgi:hypothetical protein